MRAERVEIEAPAKVNLRLLVLAREESGFHALETIFCAVSLADTVVVERLGRPGVELQVEGGVDTGPTEDNLVVRAARRFHTGIEEEPAIRITLRKRIPAAAGLGGGSSDAAATLLALNAAFGGAVDNHSLLRWGSELGSDVPFFLTGSPYALAWGRGERLLNLAPLPSRPVVIAHPGVPLSTAGAFRRIAESRADGHAEDAAAIALHELSSWDGVARLAVNHFEQPARQAIPAVGRGIDVLRRAGATLAMLSGSGASIFGVFEPGSDPEGVERELRREGFRCWSAATLRSFPEPTVRGEG
jgi:4-diphosphocytidyl-2-C-methyl-D-erythritol kinase